MKITVILILLAILFPTGTLASEPSGGGTGAWIKMDRYQTYTETGIVDLIEHDGWGFVSCPLARHARISPTMVGFEQAFASTLLAYSQKIRIIVHADCMGPNSDIALIKSFLLETDLTD